MAIVTKCEDCEKDTDVVAKGLKSRHDFYAKYGSHLEVKCTSCKNTWDVHVDDIRMVQGQWMFVVVPATLLLGTAFFAFVESFDPIVSLSPVAVISFIIYNFDRSERQKADEFNAEYIDSDRNARKEQEEIDAYWNQRKNKKH